MPNELALKLTHPAYYFEVVTNRFATPSTLLDGRYIPIVGAADIMNPFSHIRVL
jgi:hypothetical protein